MTDKGYKFLEKVSKREIIEMLRRLDHRVDLFTYRDILFYRWDKRYKAYILKDKSLFDKLKIINKLTGLEYVSALSKWSKKDELLRNEYEEIQKIRNMMEGL